MTASGGGRYVWYSTDGGSTYTQISTALNTTCSSVGSFSVANGTNVIFLIGTAGQSNNYATVGNGNATCPSSPAGSCQSYSIAVSGTQNVALLGNAAVSGC